jgi:predicted Zn-dependent peptidase
VRTGIDRSYLEKVREGWRRAHEVALRENGAWEQALRDAYTFGDDPKKPMDVEPALARLTPENVRAAARAYLKPRYVLGILKPAERQPLHERV